MPRYRVPRRNIVCVGKNYAQSRHAKFAQSGYETGEAKDVDEYPAVFTKSPGTVIGPEDPFQLHPPITTKIDDAAELAIIIICQEGMAISRNDALKHIWGYTIVNDFTARDVQHNHKQWCAAGSTASCARTPTPRPDLRHPDTHRHDFGRHDFAPGRYHSTGTPAGVGIGLDPPRFLEDGDGVEIE